MGKESGTSVGGIQWFRGDAKEVHEGTHVRKKSRIVTKNNIQNKKMIYIISI